MFFKPRRLDLCIFPFICTDLSLVASKYRSLIQKQSDVVTRDSEHCNVIALAAVVTSHSEAFDSSVMGQTLRYKSMR